MKSEDLILRLKWKDVVMIESVSVSIYTLSMLSTSNHTSYFHNNGEYLLPEAKAVSTNALFNYLYIWGYVFVIMVI